MNFAEELAAACEQYAVKYNYAAGNLSRGFEAFVLHLSATDGPFLSDPSAVADPMNADLSDYILRQNEGGVDGYLEDESNKVMMLLQAKYLGGKKSVDEDELKAFLDLPSILASPEREAYLKRLAPRAQTLLAPLHERSKDGWTTVLRFFTNRPVTEREQALVTAREASYASQGARVKCEIVGRDNLKAIWHEAVSGAGGIDGSVTLSLQQDRFIGFTDPRATLVGTISGNELANLFKRHRNLLFAQNIRLPLLSSTRINPDIEKTAREHPADFFYYNNGVSAICSRFEEVDGRVEAWDFQVINGAQTVGTLGNLTALSGKVRVLFRLTTAPATDQSFREEITRTNNTQNEVVPWDFRANDPIQKWLENALKPYSGSGPLPNFWYKRKRGLDAAGKGGRALEPEYLGKLRHAFIYGPVPSYKEPKRLASMADETGLYADAFGVDGKIVKVWSKSALDEAMLAYALDSHIGAKADAYKKENHPYSRWLKRLSRYVAAAVGEVSRSAPALKLDPKVLVTLPYDEFEQRVDPTLKVIMSKLNDRYELLKVDRVQPEYDMARDQKEFDRICRSVVADLTA